jgi:hypothetical protein
MASSKEIRINTYRADDGGSTDRCTLRCNPEDSHLRINTSFSAVNETQFTLVVVYKIIRSNSQNMQVETKYHVWGVVPSFRRASTRPQGATTQSTAVVTLAAVRT